MSLREVRTDKQQQDSSIEELRNENTYLNRSTLLRFLVLSNDTDNLDQNKLEDTINNINRARN